MADKLNTRIQLRHDTEENWLTVANSLIPLEGEACLTTSGSNKGRVKYGDGTSTWGELEYSGGKDLVEVDSSTVKFDDDFTFTYTFGQYTPDGSGQVSVPATGKTLDQLLLDAFAEEKNPTTTQPSVSITSSTAKAYEAGSTVSPAYSASLNAGNYSYGPATGVTATAWTVTNSWGDESLSTASGTFTEVTIPDGANYTITATVQHTEGAIPKTNLGNDYEAGKIAAGSKNKTSSAITAFRQIFYGVRTETTEITSDVVRALTNTNNKASARTLTINSTTGAKQIVVAIPQSAGLKINSANITTSLNADVTNLYVKQSGVQVEGANAYTAVAYDVYVYQPASIDSGEIHSVVIGS